MLVPEIKWIVIEHKADGTEDCDAFEFDEVAEAHGRMSELIKQAHEKHTGSSYYVTSVVWQNQIAD